MAGGHDFRAKALDLRHPFFRPPWRRITLVGVLGFWAVIEILFGNPVWGLLMGGIGAYAAHVFFFALDPRRSDHDAQKPRAPR